MKYSKMCLVCSKKFLCCRYNAKYCSQTCRTIERYKKKNERRKLPCYEVKCKWCKVKFFQKIANIQIYCSKKCMVYAYEKRQGCKKPGFQGTIRKCKLCKKEYSAYTTTQKWCSKDCRRKMDYKNNRLNKIIYNVKYNKEHIEQKRKSNNKWAKNNPDKILHNRKQYIYRKKQAGGSFTEKEWNDLKEENNHTCPKCKRKEPEIKLTADHVIPTSKWKKWRRKNKVSYKCNDIENIQPYCRQCNSSKGNRI